MSRARKIRVSLAVLFSSVLLNVILVSCAAKAVLPPQDDTGGGGGGGALDNAELLARFDSVMARLTQIEAKVDQQAEQLALQVTATGDQAAAIGAKLDTIATTVAVTQTDPMIGALQIARMDSVLAITSHIANDMASPGWEVCGSVDAGVGFAVTPNAELYGEAAADAGAWAGTGAFAGAEVHAGIGAEFELGLAGGVTFGGCSPLFIDPPPSRGAPANSPERIAAAELKTALENATSQIGLTRNRVRNSLDNLSGAIQSAGSMNIQSASQYLPLPSQLSSIVSDPVGHFAPQIPNAIDDAIQTLCSANWGSVMSSTVPVACDRIRNNPFDIGGFLSLMDQIPDMQLVIGGIEDGFGELSSTVDGLQTGFGQISSAVDGLNSGFGRVRDHIDDVEEQLDLVSTAVSNASNAFQSLCSKIDGVGGASLTVDNPLAIGPDNFYDGKLFPFYSPLGC